jgi:hypothetical protein|tara:strand:- start:8113 stop:8367 length:255 start_codon:yes stop_codon:yes gene_type:complete
MNQEFIEQQITETKSDLVFHELQLKLALTTQQGLELLPKGDNEKLIIDARDSVKWYNKRVDHDHNMLDVLFTARDAKADNQIYK